MVHEIPPYARHLSRALLSPLERYHRFRIEGLHHVPEHGPAMIVVHHTLATYDAFFIGRAIIERCGRQAIGLGDDNLFRIPVLRRLCHDLGLRPASPTAGREVLDSGGLLMLAPGGTREALRPSTLRNRSVWHDRLGFARLAIAAGVPVLVAGCPAGDAIYEVYESRLTRHVYERYRWPLPIARGRGPTLVPRRVDLVGRIGEPLVPPVASPDDQEAVVRFHAALTQRMAALLATGRGT